MDFVCFSINNWEKRRARKQQFMIHLSLRQDVGKVMYVEPALNIWRLIFFPFSELKNLENRQRWQRALSFKPQNISDKLFVFTPIFFIPFAFRWQIIYNTDLFFVFVIIRDRLKKMGFKDMVLWVYHPFDYKLLEWFKDRICSCFDWAEDWAAYFTEYSAAGKLNVKKKEEKIIVSVDQVFVVSYILFDRAKLLNQNSYILRDGVIFELFVPGVKVPADMAGIKHPVVGYVGTVFSRFDIGLIEALSDKFPEYSFVFVGKVLLDQSRLAGLKARKNVFFLGGKSYEDMVPYLMSFDVCILPYLPAQIPPPPTKIFDYLATGKPIVTTNLAELNDFKGFIRMASTREEFAAYLKEGMVEQDVDKSAKRVALAKNNSWAVRVQEIVDLINNRIRAR